MSRRKWFLSIVIAFLLLLASGIGWRILAKSHITKSNFERIEAGMTEAEVENLLGGPADEYVYECFLGAAPTDDGVGGNWYGSGVTINVSFHNDKVVDKELRPSGRELSTDNFFWSTKHRLRRYFGL